MNRCDFSSVMSVISSGISEKDEISQIELMFLLFEDFLNNDVNIDFGFDNGLVCRWLNGTAKVSPQIISYYAKNEKYEALAFDLQKNILPLLYDKDMTVTEIYNLLMNDTTISENKRAELSQNYPYDTGEDLSDFISRILIFGMERAFLKRDAKTKALISRGALSPAVKDYIYDGIVPKPCKHFCGREAELETLHNVLDENGKVFIQGVAGIGKSEFAKQYAKKYKNEYTNILYFSYNGSLKQMIADCDFSDDSIDDNDDIKFRRHNRFLRSLKEDTLIIIDNFNETASSDELLSVIMKYRCKVVFTTRSKFENYASYNLEEMPLNDLLTLAQYFYDESNIETVEQIISEVHRHTLSVELSARLLSRGMFEPQELLDKLINTKSILRSNDKINLFKDGANSKATYYEHIHTLISLLTLSDEGKNIMRNMTLVPYEGINTKLFAKWLNLDSLNEVNDLIEYGFIQTNDYRKITLHPLIKEVAIDDTVPSVASCETLIENIRSLCLYHGKDLPFHSLLFRIAESVIDVAEKDNIGAYKLFLKDVFAYMEKYNYRSGMELIISELERLKETVEDKALLLDYKAALEHLCGNNTKRALQYEQQAVKLCDEIVSVNPHLVSNIYGNIGALYHTDKQLEKAKHYMELAYKVLAENNLEFTNDAVIQICNYANLAANMGEPQLAIRALKQCAEAVKEYNSENTSDYANLMLNIGCTYLQIHDRANALYYFKSAFKIYIDIWSNEPELINDKLRELQGMSAVLGADIQKLITS
ncbi:MAG: ATP-binding protein [Firmicutes bacterium]|nr:ATP-binding protein [Bacillota bacterium]